MSDKFDTADYYDCCDDEELTYDTPEESIEMYLDGFLVGTEDPLAVIRSLCPITVTAYNCRRIDDKEEWPCTEVAKREYSVDDVIAILKESWEL